MRKNNFSLVLSSLFGIIFLISLVSAAITVVSPTTYSNYTGAFGPLVSFNVSYINSTDFTDALNATFYYNLSGAWAKIGSSTNCHNSAAGSLSSCNVSLNLSGVTDGRYSISANLSNSTTTSAASVLTNNIIFDSTSPAVSFSGITNVVNNGNYSQTITLNASVVDALIGIGSVYFNITNSTGNQVNFTSASSSGGYYNLGVNTLGFPDGLYNITVFANDSLNNLNNSAEIQITIDNTPPTGVFSCSPSQVQQGSTVNCSCTSSDALSGINATGNVYTIYPDTSQTGTFTTTCIFGDNAGNQGSASAAYSVIYTAITPSTTSTGGTTTTSSNAPVTTTQSFANIIPSVPVTMSSFNTNAVKQISVAVNQAVNNVQVTVDAYDSKPDNVSLEKTNTYKYLHINVQNLDNSNISNANMTIQVNKTWASANNLTQNDVSVFRYNETTNQWDNLPTTFLSEDSNYYSYNVQLNHFSYFAISSNKEPSLSTTTGVSQQPSVPPTSSGSYWVWIIAGIVIVVIILVGIILFMKIKKKKLFGL